MSNKKMMQQVVVPLVALLVGLIIGGVAGEQGLLGTAADTNGNTGGNIEIQPERFYLVKYEDAQSFLEGRNEGDNALGDSISTLGNLADTVDLGQFVNSQDSVNTVLLSLQDALITDDADGNSIDAITTCVGVEASSEYNPSGPGLYVYVEVPEDVEVPEEFEDSEIDEQLESSLTWAASCIKGEEAAK